MAKFCEYCPRFLTHLPWYVVEHGEYDCAGQEELLDPKLRERSNYGKVSLQGHGHCEVDGPCPVGANVIKYRNFVLRPFLRTFKYFSNVKNDNTQKLYCIVVLFYLIIIFVLYYISFFTKIVLDWAKKLGFFSILSLVERQFLNIL